MDWPLAAAIETKGARRPARAGRGSLRLRAAFAGVSLLLATGPAAAQALDGPRFFLETPFIRGDFNADARADLSDASAIFNWLFLGGPEASCLNAGDTNVDDRVDVSDGLFLLNWLFLGGPEPPAPGPLACGIDPRDGGLPCAAYRPCPDDRKLVLHVLNRITFGPTEELLSRIQTRAELVRYIEEQLDAPEEYDQATHELELHERIEALEIGFNPDGPTPVGMVNRLEAMLLLNALASRWQLLQRVAVFWNNHFHTQTTTLRENFFSRGGRGGGALRASTELFDAVDTDASGSITEAEWNAFRADHPGAMLWTDFRAGLRRDGVVTLDELLQQDVVAWWKYRGGREQFGVSADMERREVVAFRRHAFGRFGDLLEMSAKSVAQLIYLNTFENTVVAPNENYAREYFELFALGADHVYTQRDIEEVAKVFTGWTAGWHLRSLYDEGDILKIGHPEGANLPINLREPPPFRFPLPHVWSDATYTWGFHFGNPPPRVGGDGHDWGRKDIFLARYGGVDSLGNPVPPSLAIRIAENTSDRTVAAAMREFDLVLERTVSLRDCAKFISTKLIQLFVTDDLSRLGKTRAMPQDLDALFRAADLDGDGGIEQEEWEATTPDLPNGKPPELFERLDADGNGTIERIEYQEPDMLLDAIAAWQRSGGSIREVLRAILLSEEFLSTEFYRAKIKDPFENFASALRAIEADLTPEQLLLATNDLQLAGMELFDFADPTGESELGFDWMHTVGLLERLKFVSRAANPASAAEARATWNVAGFQRRWGLNDARTTVDFFSLLLLGGDLLENERELAQEAYERGATGTGRIRSAVAFLLSLPAFQKQ